MKTKLTILSTKLFQHKEYLVVYLLMFVSYIILLPKTGHPGDTAYWNEWSKYIFNNGLKNIYKSGTDYLPLYHYILFLFGKFQGSIEAIEHNIQYLKAVTLLFDFVAGFLIVKYLRSKFDNNQSFLYSFFFFFNIGYFYNTMVWGQVDGIEACLVFLAFFMAMGKRVMLSVIFILLSVNFKLQAVVFVPLIGLLLLPTMTEQFSFRKLTQWIIVPFSIQFLILLPFITSGDIKMVWKVTSESVGRYPIVSANAYNFWFLVIRGYVQHVKDDVTFLGITYKNWGLLLFFVTSFFAMLPLIRSVFWRLLYKQSFVFDQTKTFIIATLIPLLFFFFNTEMHERYLHPALLFLAVYSIATKKYLPYIVVSVAYFLNLEDVLQYFQLKNYETLIFHPAFIAFLFLISIVYLFFNLYGVTFHKSEKIVTK